MGKVEHESYTPSKPAWFKQNRLKRGYRARHRLRTLHAEVRPPQGASQEVPCSSPLADRGSAASLQKSTLPSAAALECQAAMDCRAALAYAAASAAAKQLPLPTAMLPVQNRQLAPAGQAGAHTAHTTLRQLQNHGTHPKTADS